MAFSKFRIDVAGKEKQARTTAYIVAGILGFLFMRIGLLMSPIISVIGGGLGYLLVNTLIESSWKQVQMDIDSELPLFLTGFSSTVQIQQDKLTAVYEEAQTLNPEGSLRKWLLERFVAEYERYGAECIPGDDQGSLWHFQQPGRDDVHDPAVLDRWWRLGRCFCAGNR